MLVTLTACLVAIAGRAVGGGSDARTEVVVVEAGQTLWSIARAEVGAEADPRPLIEEIRELNELDTSALLAGQQLVLPAT